MNLGSSTARHCAWPLLAALFLCACGRSDGLTERRWTEDVLLDDGSTIVVKRTVVFRETNAFGGGAYNAVESDATLTFTGNLASLPKWREPLMALLLYRDAATDEWVIVATTTSCVVWNHRGEPRVMYLRDKPDTLYWEYRLGLEGWREVPFSRSSVGRPVNLLHRYQQDFDRSHVTVEFRRAQQSSPSMARRFATILERYDVRCGVSAEGKKRRQLMDAGTDRTGDTEEANHGN